MSEYCAKSRRGLCSVYNCDCSDGANESRMRDASRQRRQSGRCGYRVHAFGSLDGIIRMDPAHSSFYGVSCSLTHRRACTTNLTVLFILRCILWHMAGSRPSASA